jgi:enoyl-CoA hydratase
VKHESSGVSQMNDYLLPPSRYWSCTVDPMQPVGLVDLAAWPREMPLVALPSFPVIGVGDPAHPVAKYLDTVTEAPASVDCLIKQILGAPRAASVAVQLLRALTGLPADRALPIESFSYGLLQGSAEHAAWLAAPDRENSRSAAGRLLVERRESELLLTLDRPWAHNALDRALRDALFDAFTVAELDKDVTAVKLRANGKVFSVGGDLAEFGTTRDPATAHLIRAQTLPSLPLSRRPEILTVHIQGACIGAGLELAAFARRITAAPGAWFQLPELRMGLIPGAGGNVSLPRRIGRQRTALLILSGRRISAATALRWGLIDAISASGD